MPERPEAGQTEQEYLSDCMADPKNREEFPNQNQRFAVCRATWDRFRGSRIIHDVGASRSFQPSDCHGIVPFDDGVDLLTDPKTHEVLAIGFDKFKFPGAEVLDRWLGESTLPLAQIEGAVKLETGRKLFAPEVSFEIFPTQLQQHTGLVMKALPITPGTHKGFKFSEEVIIRAAPLFENAPIVEHHTFNVPSDVKGRIMEVAIVMGRVVVTALILDSESAAKIRSGHFHSVSVHIILEADDDLIVAEISQMVEMTLTDDPADPNAVILAHEDTRILIAEGIQLAVRATSESTPPATEASTNQLEENSLENNNQANPEPTSGGTSTGPAPAPVAMEAPTPTPATAPVTAPAPAPAPAALEAAPAAPPANGNEDTTRIAQLEREVADQKAAIQFMARAQRAKDAVILAKSLVRDGRIAPAQEDSAGKLIAGLSDEQRTLFEEFVGHNQVAPLGGAEAANAGMVSSQSGSVNLEKMIQGMTDQELEFLKFVDLNQEFEARGGHTPEIAARHQQPGFFGGVFPTLEHGNQPDRRGYEQ